MDKKQASSSPSPELFSRAQLRPAQTSQVPVRQTVESDYDKPLPTQEQVSTSPSSSGPLPLQVSGPLPLQVSGPLPLQVSGPLPLQATGRERVPTNPPSRKRQTDESEDDNPQPKRALTHENLALFDRLEGRLSLLDRVGGALALFAHSGCATESQVEEGGALALFAHMGSAGGAAESQVEEGALALFAHGGAAESPVKEGALALFARMGGAGGAAESQDKEGASALFARMGGAGGATESQEKEGGAVALFARRGGEAEAQSTTASCFALQAHKNNILDPIGSKPPANLEDIRERHARSRATASPTESEYNSYVRKVARVPNEATMIVEMSRHMLEEDDDDSYHQVFNRPFTGFPEEVGFNHGLPVPQPDFVEGLEMGEFKPFPVDEQVDGAVLYKDNPRSMALAHLAGEWRGPGRNMEEARLESAYHGAALVFARNQALDAMGRSDPPGHANVTTFVTDGITLNLFAHYATEAEDGALEYHQYRVKSTNLVDSHEGFKDGCKQLRNAQDHARDQSYALRDDLRAHWRRHGPDAGGAPLAVPDPQVNAPSEEDTVPYRADDEASEVVDQHRSMGQPPSSRHSWRHSW
ncbi:hypothetical protein OQA88_13705 [Cercophora sp. LCS_1]